MTEHNKAVRRNLIIFASIMAGLIAIAAIVGYFFTYYPEMHLYCGQIYCGILIAMIAAFIVLLLVNILFFRKGPKQDKALRRIYIATYIILAVILLMTIQAQNFSSELRAKVLYHDAKKDISEGNIGLARRELLVVLELDPETEYREDIEKWLAKIDAFMEEVVVEE
jgi:hypothetical protein